jgi:hypothetical protein
MTPHNRGVDTHPMAIPTSVFFRTVLRPFTRPTPVTPPTTAWEVDTGTPTCVNKWTVIAAENVEIKAENSSRWTIFFPQWP